MKQTRIEKFFEQYASSVLKWRWPIILLIALIVLFGALGLKKLDIIYSNQQLFLASDSLNVKTEEFREIFGNELFVGILVKNDTLFSREQLQKLKLLTQELEANVPHVERVNSITNLHFPKSTEGKMQLTRLIPDQIPVSRDSLERIRNYFLEKRVVFNRMLSGDGTSSWVTINLRNFHNEEDARQEVQANILVGSKVQEIISDPKFSSLHPKATGVPYINYMEKQYFNKESRRIIIFALVIAVLILTLLTRSFTGVLAPFIVTLVSLLTVFGIGGWFDLSVAGLVISLPILLSLAVAIAYSIHILTFHKKYLRDGFSNKESIIKTLSTLGWPMLFTSLTTFFALQTILLIRVPAIREIGVITAFCVLVVFTITFILLPILLSFIKRGVTKAEKRILSESLRSSIQDTYLKIVLNHQNSIFGITLILVVVGVIGLSKVRATFDLKGSVGENVPYIHNILTVANSELGALYSYDVELDFVNGDDIITPENLEKFEELTQEIKKSDLTKNVTSVLNIIKAFNYIMHDFDPEAYSIPKTKTEIDVIVFLIRTFGFNELGNWVNQKNHKARIITELGQYDSKSLKEDNKKIREKAENMFDGVKVSMLGTVPQFAKVNGYVVNGQILSFTASILIILLLIIIEFGSVRVGLIALIPNLIPVIIIGGIMGFMNIPLDMMTVTIIPIMIGLGVDDTIHLFSHFKKEFGKTKNYYSSIQRSISKVGPALIYTTVILSANFMIYTFSDAKIFVNTGLLTTIGLLTALAADLLLAPILFRHFSVFGKEFEEA